ncbi:MAG: hypothetical protein RMM06_07270 [Armatimonadota bacterium]|nr:hypothetical protein [bacterium]MCS7310500.1 hypothetical protein [Armatimonadota bacterium]MDW8290509.1 hypothetical protein [Armatimonadota bacterium]
MTASPRWRKLLRASLLVLAVGGVLLVVPLPLVPASVLTYRQALVVFGIVVALGKLLYDTLFYDHYWP